MNRKQPNTVKYTGKLRHAVWFMYSLKLPPKPRKSARIESTFTTKDPNEKSLKSHENFIIIIAFIKGPLLAVILQSADIAHIIASPNTINI